jgi:hypothetical protein
MHMNLAQGAGVALVGVVGVAGALFAAGEILADPGGWEAVGLVAAWGVPLIGLSILALRRPERAGRVLTTLLVLGGGLVLASALGGWLDRDRWGPVDTLALFAVAIPCGLLGVHLARRAGLSLLAASALQMGATLVGMDREGGQSIGSALGGSRGVLVLPYLVVALFFLLASLLEGHRSRPRASRLAH